MIIFGRTELEQTAKDEEASFHKNSNSQNTQNVLFSSVFNILLTWLYE